MTVLPEDVVTEMLDRLEEDFKTECYDAKEQVAFIKEKRTWWQLVTLRMVRKRLERLKVEI